MTRKTHFIGIEVNIKSSSACESLIKDLENQGCLVTKWPSEQKDCCWTIEPEQKGGADPTILCFCKNLKQFSERSLREWGECEEREFYVGYRVGEEPFCYRDCFSTETLAMVAKLDASIGLAMYPAEPTDKAGLPIALQG